MARSLLVPLHIWFRCALIIHCRTLLFLSSCSFSAIAETCLSGEASCPRISGSDVNDRLGEEGAGSGAVDLSELVRRWNEGLEKIQAAVQEHLGERKPVLYQALALFFFSVVSVHISSNFFLSYSLFSQPTLSPCTMWPASKQSRRRLTTRIPTQLPLCALLWPIAFKR